MDDIYVSLTLLEAGVANILIRFKLPAVYTRKEPTQQGQAFVLLEHFVAGTARAATEQVVVSCNAVSWLCLALRQIVENKKELQSREGVVGENYFGGKRMGRLGGAVKPPFSIPLPMRNFCHVYQQTHEAADISEPHGARWCCRFATSLW